MAMDATERKVPKPSQAGGPPLPEPELLPCPRCDSTNTKFCYYNNYNFSQPRHFCKSCRRYWTRGGTLRDIPVGGGSRRNAKRSRTACSISSSPASGASAGGGASVFSPVRHDFRRLPASAPPLLFPVPADRVAFVGDGKVGGSFTSLLNSGPGTGLLALGGFGLGLGFDDMSFGLGRGLWPITVEGGTTSGDSNSGAAGDTWHLENGDCVALPDLAISTPGNILK